MTRKSLAVSFLAACVLAAATFLVVAYHAKAQPSSIQIETSASATTTMAFLTAGTASSTFQVDSNGTFSSSKVPNMQSIDSTSVYVEFLASSTGSALVVTPQWSNNNIDWYGTNTATAAVPAISGILQFASSTNQWYWTPGTTATSTMVFTIPTIPAQHLRFVYGAQGANGSVYTEYDLKRNPNSP